MRRQLTTPLWKFNMFANSRTMRMLIALVTSMALYGCDESLELTTDSLTAISEAERTLPNSFEMVGRYLCTVAEKASIESLHLEDAGPPTAVSQRNVATRFRIEISKQEDGQSDKLSLVELNYDGPDRDPTEWQTRNSVLHSSYVGNGSGFQSTDAEFEGFFVLGPTVHSNADGDLAFYHSGFEWAGGEDTYLSIRWGRCKKT